MDNACYLCRRTQTDLDHLNEEIRARVYLSYFSNARGQIDDQRRRLTFLQRLKDEESGDPHFRIGAQQVFADPGAYKKLMPWVDTLIEIAAGGRSAGVQGSMGELVDALLTEERQKLLRMEEGLNHLRSGFASGGRSPFSLHEVTSSFPVEWPVEAQLLVWRPGGTNDREPLRHPSGSSERAVEVPLYICSVCQKLTGRA